MTKFNPTDDKKIENILMKKARQLKHRDSRSLYVNVGIIGILGGIIIFPILLGIFLGGWLDEAYPVSKLSWRLNLILIGAMVGFFYGWLWIKYEGIYKVDTAYQKEQEQFQQRGKK